jgi:hypothetical protein
MERLPQKPKPNGDSSVALEARDRYEKKIL